MNDKLMKLAAIACCLQGASVCAQIVSPDVLVAPAPRAPEVRHREAGREDLQWLWSYSKPAAAGDKPGLLADRRFAPLLKEELRAPQAMWGVGIPTGEAARTFLGGEGVVDSDDQRHLRVTGCVVDHCAQRGMLWVDLGERDPLMVFVAMRWTEQGHTTDEANAIYTLWLFPSRTTEADQLPAALKQSLSRWALGKDCKPANISSVVVVEPSGVPHVLGSLDVLQPEVCGKPWIKRKG